MRKFVGDKMSIEATSHDGRLWKVHVFDRGHLTEYLDTPEVELARMAAKKGMRLVQPQR